MEKSKLSPWSLNQLNLIESGIEHTGEEMDGKDRLEGAKNQDTGTFKWVDHELCTKVLNNLTLIVLVGTSQEFCVTRLAMVPSHMFNMRIFFYNVFMDKQKFKKKKNGLYF